MAGVLLDAHVMLLSSRIAHAIFASAASRCDSRSKLSTRISSANDLGFRKIVEIKL